MTLRRSARVAKALADHPPTLDAAARARMEEALLQAARLRALPPARSHEELAARLAAAAPSLDPARRRALEDALVAARSSRGPRGVGARVAVAGLAVAAAVGFALLGPRAAEAPAVVAVAPGGDGTTVRVLEAGREIESGPVTAPRSFALGERGAAQLAHGASSVALAPASRATLLEASDELFAIELASGAVRVAFHPAAPGRQSLVVHTPRARVEVVGTVFRVEVGAEGATRVAVEEGVVRVVEREGGASHLVRSGERWEVAAPTVAALGALDAAREEPAEAGAGAAPFDATPVAAAPVGGRRPEARLAEAARLFDQARFAEARAVLRPLGSAAPATAARALTLTAEIHAREGSLEAAAAAYAEAARRGEGTTHGANALYALGRLLERRLGDPTAARRAYASYLEASPEGPLASQAALALCRLGDASRCR